MNSILNPNLPLGEGVFDPEQETADVVEENAQEVPQGKMRKVQKPSSLLLKEVKFHNI